MPYKDQNSVSTVGGAPLQVIKQYVEQRKHVCSECGYTTHRDTAAAEVILGRSFPSNATPLGEANIPVVMGV